MEIFNKIETEENVCQKMAEGETFDMDHCLARFYARTINCTSPWEKDLESTDFLQCNTSTQYKGTHLINKAGSRLRETTSAARGNHYMESQNLWPNFLF